MHILMRVTTDCIRLIPRLIKINAIQFADGVDGDVIAQRIVSLIKKGIKQTQILMQYFSINIYRLS